GTLDAGQARPPLIVSGKRLISAAPMTVGSGQEELPTGGTANSVLEGEAAVTLLLTASVGNCITAQSPMNCGCCIDVTIQRASILLICFWALIPTIWKIWLQKVVLSAVSHKRE